MEGEREGGRGPRARGKNTTAGERFGVGGIIAHHHHQRRRRRRHYCRERSRLLFASEDGIVSVSPSVSIEAIE